MTTSEPTSEIVKEITNQSTTYDIIVALKMIVQYLESFTMDKMSRDVMSAAADRIKSQEREIERLKEKLEQIEEAATVLHAANETHWTYIKELTSRAEKAERERDAAIKDITRLCTRCKHWTCPNDDEPCLSCLNAESGNPNWTWRGLPQEGDGR